LHYVAQEGDATFDQEVPEPEQVDEEELATDEEDEQPQQDYTTYVDFSNLQGSIDDMSNLELSLRSTSADLNMDFSNWSQEWAPDQRPQ
jgi:hypothetical protein